MKQFLNTFFSGVVTNSELSKAQKKDLILFFMDASQSNPLYNDPDRELVDAYVHNSKTQFTRLDQSLRSCPVPPQGRRAAVDLYTLGAVHLTLHEERVKKISLLYAPMATFQNRLFTFASTIS